MENTIRAWVGGAATLALALGLTACGGTGDAASSSTSSTTQAGATDAPSTDAASATETSAGDGSTEASRSGTSTADESATATSTTDASATASPTTPSATTVTARDKSFTLRLPAGWSDDATAAGPEANVAVKAAAPLAGFTPNLRVTSAAAPGGDLAALVANTGRQKASQAGGTFTALPPRALAGTKAPGYQITREYEGKKLVQKEYFVAHAGKLHIVTLTSAAAQAAQADAAFTRLLAGWVWAK